MENEDIGRRIKIYLKERKISQRQLSRATGIKPEKLNLILNGKRKMSVIDYLLISETLKVDMKYFLRETKN